MMKTFIFIILFSLYIASSEARMSGWLRQLFQIEEATEEEESLKLPIELEDIQLSCSFAGRYPFIVSIRDRSELKNHICGGILIKKDAVLTAAHCVDPRSTRNAVVMPQVHLAGYDLEEPIEILQTVRPFPHPDWNGNLKDGNDLVILKLEKKSCLTPIEGIGNSTKLSNKNTYHVYSFGRSGTAGAFTNLLQYSPLKYINPSKCQKKHDVIPRDTEVCFSGENEINVCPGMLLLIPNADLMMDSVGDDGSPLTKTPGSVLAYDPEVVGIVSYTTGPCTKPGAAVFTNVYAYKEWIELTLKSKEFKRA